VKTTIIQRKTGRVEDTFAESRWFLPADSGITAQMIDDVGKLWSSIVTCNHDLSFPEGTFVTVRVNTRGLDNLYGKTLHHLNAFAEAFDEAMTLWSPTDPFGSVQLFENKIYERQLMALGIHE
jgi:hypothetical protein